VLLSCPAAVAAFHALRMRRVGGIAVALAFLAAAPPLRRFWHLQTQTGTSIVMIEKAYLRFIPSAMQEKLAALKGSSERFIDQQQWLIRSTPPLRLRVGIAPPGDAFDHHRVR